MAAQAPVAFVNTGEIVCFQEKTCIVTNVNPDLGFNTYNLLDIDSGKTVRAHRHQLDKVNVVDLGLSLDYSDNEWEADEHTSAGASTSTEPTGAVYNDPMPEIQLKQSRFAKVTQEDLDKLSTERNAQNTTQQTKWGVKVFRGNSSFVYS